MVRWILWLFFRKEVEEMAVIYATLIIKGKKTFAQVPVKIQEQVRQVLIDLECEDLINE
jgi:hypothetical protein